MRKRSYWWIAALIARDGLDHFEVEVVEDMICVEAFVSTLDFVEVTERYDLARSPAQPFEGTSPARQENKDGSL